MVRPVVRVEYVTVGSDTCARCNQTRPRSILVSLASNAPGAATTTRRSAARIDVSYSCGSEKFRTTLLDMGRPRINELLHIALSQSGGVRVAALHFLTGCHCGVAHELRRTFQKMAWPSSTPVRLDRWTVDG